MVQSVQSEGKELINSYNQPETNWLPPASHRTIVTATYLRAIQIVTQVMKLSTGTVY